MDSKSEILWVDDDLAQIQEGAEFLRDHGLKVVLFKSPNQCAEYIAEINGQCKVVMVDVIMPGFNSITVPVDMGFEQIPTLKSQKTRARYLHDGLRETTLVLLLLEYRRYRRRM